MRILIVANNDVGLYKFRRELVEELLKDNDVHICLPYGEYIEKLTVLGCVYHACEFDRHGTNPLAELKQLFFYKKLLKKVNPGIVFTYTVKPNVYAGMACASLSIPYVANITGLGTAIENGGFMQKVILFLLKCGLRKAKKVFFQNESNRDFLLKKGVVKGTYDMLPGSGVNLQRFVPIEYPGEERVEFAFISRIMKEKGIDQYIKAAEYIRENHTNTVFHVCGFCEQDYEERLRNLHDRGIIVYHGMIRDVNAFMKDIHCTVHPTYYPEGISNVLLESCASARPIITTNRPGCREVIDDTVNGYVVREKDDKDLIAKIEMFLDLSYEQKKAMGQRGREKVEREFDRNIVVGKYIAEVKNHGWI